MLLGQPRFESLSGARGFVLAIDEVLQTGDRTVTATSSAHTLLVVCRDVAAPIHGGWRYADLYLSLGCRETSIRMKKDL
jgi:hypothetical protein